MQPSLSPLRRGDLAREIALPVYGDCGTDIHQAIAQALDTFRALPPIQRVAAERALRRTLNTVANRLLAEGYLP